VNGEYAGTVSAKQFLPSSYCKQNVAHVSQFCSPLPVPTTHSSLSNYPTDVCLPTTTHNQPTCDNDCHSAAQELSCLLTNGSLLC